ncbi:MAG: Wzz/FepE/Etk N-terminal domain-containing protein [Pseudomonadota bacterium]
MSDVTDWGPSRAVEAEPGYARARPRLSFIDLILQLWRAKWLMMLIFLPIFILGILVAVQMPKTFESTSRLLIRAGVETSAVTVGNDNARQVTPDVEQVVQAELELLRSPVVAERTLSRFSLKRLYPKLEEALNHELARSSVEEEEAIRFEFAQQTLEAFEKSFRAGAPPKNPVINVAFEHKDPQIASEVLNAAMGAYLSYRSELFSSRPVDQLTTQRRRFEVDLVAAEDAIREFLRRNRIEDFGSERSTAQGLYTTLSGELSAAQSRASAVQGQLSRTRAQIASTEREQDIFVEDNSDQTLLDLRLEREDLLSRYTEDSRAVQAIDKRIEEVEAFLAEKQGPQGTVRRGPNPTYQTLETTLNAFEAEAEALASQQIELQRQLTRVERTLARFTQLEPEWNELQRKRQSLEDNVRLLTRAEQEEGTIKNIAQDGTDSVSILEPARVPLRGSSLRFPIAVLALLFAGFTALMAGLLRALTRDGFPTPSALSRTTGLPVLGAVSQYR